jgi:hypothetical protein
MFCITGTWAASFFLLAWVLAVLLNPAAYRDAIFAPPQWLMAPGLRWLRISLVTLVGATLAVMALSWFFIVPLAFGEFRWLTLGIVASVIALWGLVRGIAPPSDEVLTSMDGCLRVRGRWVPWFLLAVGTLLLVLAGQLLSGG